jgi:putative SOS response-associated peptidase YedK
MCGRYVAITKVQAIEKRFGVKALNPDEFQPNSNICPGQKAPVITNKDPNVLQQFRFGFSPSWAQKSMMVINARSEGDQNQTNDRNYTGGLGIISKPMFRTAIRSKRCLVIADAFIEGPEQEKLSRPYCVYINQGKRPFAFAGIWDEWVNPQTGEIIPNFAIITTQATEVLAKIGHHRSPVILSEEQEHDWLNQSLPLETVCGLLRPFDDEMNAYPISAAIKSPHLHDISLLQPVGERIIKEYTYSFHEDLELQGMGATQARQRRLFED